MRKCLLFFLMFSGALLFGEESLLIQKIVVIQDRENLEDRALSDDAIEIEIVCDREGMKKRLAPYLNEPLSEETLQKIKGEIVAYLAESDDSLILVQIPEQNVTAGTIAVLVETAKVNKITVSGNRWFSSQNIERVMRIKKGEEVRESDLLNSGAWVSRNPFIHTDVVLSPGSIERETNIDVVVKDRLPARFYAGTDNTGNSFSGDNRFFVGTNFCIGLNNLLTYQFTSGYDFPEFLAHYGNWTIFLPWKNELVFYGGYATIHPDIPDFESKGTDIQGSMRYTIPFKPLYLPFQHQFTWGADYKQTDSSLFFIGSLSDGTTTLVPVNQKRADLFQFYFGYQLVNRWKDLRMTFKLEALASPFEALPHQHIADYQSLRPGSHVRYIYSRLAWGTSFPLTKNFTMSTLIRGQAANTALLPSEQFGLGGYDTVRGYEERIFLADNAVVGNFEVQSKPVSFSKKKMDEFFLLAFIDAAYGYNWNHSPSYPKDAWLLGIGPGLRYQVLPYLALRADYGFRVHNTSFGNGQLGRFHFSFTWGY